MKKIIIGLALCTLLSYCTEKGNIEWTKTQVLCATWHQAPYASFLIIVEVSDPALASYEYFFRYDYGNQRYESPLEHFKQSTDSSGQSILSLSFHNKDLPPSLLNSLDSEEDCGEVELSALVEKGVLYYTNFSKSEKVIAPKSRDFSTSIGLKSPPN
jgi:hypothetical protein